jgi:A/G-specific adenine glycosylase
MPRAAAIPDAADRRRFRDRLLRWYRRNGRDLPWRKTSDPYHILVSEIMLQQTLSKGRRAENGHDADFGTGP